jgi:kynurenine formamidase
MPYILSPIIKNGSQAMWREGSGYEKKSIYKIEGDKLPPVNYDEHILRPHSLTHIETPAHTIESGARLESYFQNHPNYFFGKTFVIKLSGNQFKKIDEEVYHWEISPAEIQERLKKFGNERYEKLLITIEDYPENNDGYHDPNYVLTLSQEGADFLVSLEGFHLYGTSWKSSDFNPGKHERPIHNTLFSKALVLENLKLNGVPEGVYFMSAFPLPLNEASESPVVPVLFTKEEVLSKWLA